MTALHPDGAVADAVIAFLRHSPFDHMEDATLAALAAACRVAYFAQGEIVISPATGAADTFYVVNRSRVTIEQSDSNVSVGAHNLVIGPDECFPISALLGARATDSAACAICSWSQANTRRTQRDNPTGDGSVRSDIIRRHYGEMDEWCRAPNTMKRAMRCHDFGSEREARHAA